MSSLVPNKEARFFECSWVGQFRAIDADKAKLFAQAVADVMQNMGVHDVGYDARIMPRETLTDDEARTTLINHVRPESADRVPHPWDDGNYIFPIDHPLHAMEDAAYSEWVRSGKSGAIPEKFRTEYKELEVGDGE